MNKAAEQYWEKFWEGREKPKSVNAWQFEQTLIILYN